MTPTRRQFLRYTASLGIAGGSAAAILEKLALSTALAQTQTDYKAIVCVFLFGGSDANQMVVPLSGANANFGSADVTGGYPAYFNERNLAGAGLVTTASGTLAASTLTPTTNPVPNGNLWPISAGAANPNLGYFGLNYNLGTTFNATTGAVTIPIPSFAALYNQGKAAAVCDVGTLVQPMSKAQYQSPPAGFFRPDQLFSHSDQVSENQTCIFVGARSTGWGGRTADNTASFNTGHSFPMETSISGAQQYLSGQNTQPLVIAAAPTGLNQVLVLNGFGTAADEVARKTAFTNIRDNPTDLGTNKLVGATAGVMDEAISVLSALSTDPTLTVPDPNNPANKIALTFPNTSLGNQLKQVAKVIKANLTQPALALKRQIFFVSLGGFDTHQNENQTQPGLLAQVNQAMATFYYWLKNNVPTTTEAALGDLTPKVTCFTMSDFSRTFNPSGSGAICGTDHAWGSHWLLMGGAVNGGALYGVPLPGGNGEVFPTLGKGTSNAYDVDNANGRGRFIPSVSTLQYANTLAAWYGLPQDNATLDLVFPRLRTNFAQTNLGFV
jgi:uncharacterized protein (DUF1501 family)